MPADEDAPYRVKREDQSLRMMTVANLRKAILGLRFQPGERLTERELCAMTGVSRTSIREALRHLETEGLIQNVPHRGPSVATLSPEDAGEIYEVRAALEPLAIRLFVERASDSSVTALMETARRYAQAVTRKDTEALLNEIVLFYETLFQGCGNRVAASMARTLYVRASYLRAVTFQRQTRARSLESIRNITQMARAIKRRDASAAVAACLQQVERSRAVAMSVIEEIAQDSIPAVPRRASCARPAPRLRRATQPRREGTRD